MNRLALATLAIAWPAHAGPCRYHHDLGFVPAVLTPEGATLDSRGGVVVAAESTRLDRAQLADVSVQDWKFGAGGKHEVGKRTVIAPGLLVSAPTVVAGELEFENVDNSRALGVHYDASAKLAPLPAPKVAAVTYRDREFGIMTRELTEATLATAPPAGAIAVVVYAGDVARSWAPIEDGRDDKLDVMLYVVDDCVQQIPGTIATRAGDRVTLAWLDATGHLSPRSAAITVRR